MKTSVPIGPPAPLTPRPKPPPLLTYPARPVQGGRLGLAPPKRGQWCAEPKLNGWRTLVHAPSGTMWNRYGERLTIAHCFSAALALLRTLSIHGLTWIDCEALERRHGLGRGTLVILDYVGESATYGQRRLLLESILKPLPFLAGLCSGSSMPCESVELVPSIPANSAEETLAFYRRLRAANRALRCTFFEGVVMKRVDSVYPVQLRSPSEEFRGWCKHRFVP